jgi:hypothetical protein
MIKRESLHKKLAIAAMAGMLMLLLTITCVAQTPLVINVTENCSDCSANASANGNEDGSMTYAGTSHSPGLEDTVQEMPVTVGAANSVPGRATLVSPKDTIGSKNPTFVWRCVPGSTQYRIKVVTANDQSLIKQTSWLDAEDVLLSDQICSINIGLNLPRGSYRWQVQAKNLKGPGEWSYLTSFKYLLKIPGRTTPLSPQGLISTTTPTFVWTAISAATEYNLQVCVNAGGNAYPKVVDEMFDAYLVTNGLKCSAFLPLPGDDVVYFWRIRAHNDAGYGPWSGYWYFETICGDGQRAMKKELDKKSSAAKKLTRSLRMQDHS